MRLTSLDSYAARRTLSRAAGSGPASEPQVRSSGLSQTEIVILSREFQVWQEGVCLSTSCILQTLSSAGQNCSLGGTCLSIQAPSDAVMKETLTVVEWHWTWRSGIAVTCPWGPKGPSEHSSDLGVAHPVSALDLGLFRKHHPPFVGWVNLSPVPKN